MPKTKAQLIAEAQVVKNETQVGANTATRVGEVLEDLATDGTTFATGEFIGDVGIDATPTQGSDNLVESGGVAEKTFLPFENGFGGGKTLYIATDGTITTANDGNYIVMTWQVSKGMQVVAKWTAKSTLTSTAANAKRIVFAKGDVAVSAGNVVTIIEDHSIVAGESGKETFTIDYDGKFYVYCYSANYTQAPFAELFRPMSQEFKRVNLFDAATAGFRTTNSTNFTLTKSNGNFTIVRNSAPSALVRIYIDLPNLVVGKTYHLRLTMNWNYNTAGSIYTNNGDTGTATWKGYFIRGTHDLGFDFVYNADNVSIYTNSNQFASNGNTLTISDVELWEVVGVDDLTLRIDDIAATQTELGIQVSDNDYRFRQWDYTTRTRGGTQITSAVLQEDGDIVAESSSNYRILKFPVKEGDVVSFRGEATTIRTLRIGLGTVEPAVGVTMSDVIIITPHLENGVYKYEASITSTYNGWAAVYRYVVDWVSAITEISNETIYNDQDERGSFDDNFFQLTHKYRNQNVDRWNLLFFSDIHADANSVVCLRNILNFGNTHKFYINDVLHGGDLTPNAYSNDTKLWESVNYIDTMLNTIGNHDAANLVDGALVYDVPDVDVYNRFFAPYIANWGVVQPANAATLGKCYYYKDYAGAKIRLIVLDNMCDDMDTQKTWLDSVLADAITNSLSVICCEHYSRELTKIKCGFSDVLRNPSSTGVFAPNVQTFINNGGMFVCWLTGHSHHDNFGYMTAYPDQLVFAHTVSGVVNETNSTTTAATILYTKSAAAYTIVSVDTQYHILTLWRLGRQHDQWLRQQRILVYDYANKEIIGES